MTAVSVAITLMVAESKAEEKDLMIKLILNFLHWEGENNADYNFAGEEDARG